MDAGQRQSPFDPLRMATIKQLLDSKGTAVVSLESGATVLTAARLMNAHEIGSVVVIDKGRMTGILTERDIMERVVATLLDPATTLVRDVMTSQVITCSPDATPQECVRLMAARQIRHLPVLRGDQLCGMLTSGDILAFQLQGQRDTIDYLNRTAFATRQRPRNGPLRPTWRKRVS